MHATQPNEIWRPVLLLDLRWSVRHPSTSEPEYKGSAERSGLVQAQGHTPLA